MFKVFQYAAAGSAATLASLFSVEGGAATIADFKVNAAMNQTYPTISSEAQAENDFEAYMAATLDMSEPDAGTWEEIKARLGL